MIEDNTSYSEAESSLLAVSDSLLQPLQARRKANIIYMVNSYNKQDDQYHITNYIAI